VTDRFDDLAIQWFAAQPGYSNETMARASLAKCLRDTAAAEVAAATSSESHRDKSICREAPLSLTQCVHCESVTINGQSDICGCGKELYPVSKSVPPGVRVRASVDDFVPPATPSGSAG
jgi:hypothetical protein